MATTTRDAREGPSRSSELSIAAAATPRSFPCAGPMPAPGYSYYRDSPAQSHRLREACCAPRRPAVLAAGQWVIPGRRLSATSPPTQAIEIINLFCARRPGLAIAESGDGRIREVPRAARRV